MSKILELKTKRSVALKAAGAVRDKAKADKRSLTAEETTEFNTQYDLAGSLENEIKSEEEFAAKEAKLDAEINSLSQSAGRKTAPERTAITTELKERSKDDPKKGFKSPREFMACVIKAERGRVDERLRNLDTIAIAATVGSDEAQTGSNPDGGYLLPEGFNPSVLMTQPEADPVAGRTTPVTMDRPIVKQPYRVDKDHSTSVSGGLVVSRKAETAAAAASKLAFKLMQMEAFSLFGLSYATEEILADSPQAFASILAASFGQEFGSKIIDERLYGTGVGQFLGVMNSPCLVTVSKEGGQAADTVKFENIIKMRARAWRYANSVWLANHDTLPQLMTMAFVATAIGPIWQPSLREDHPDLLLGRPIIFTENCKKLGDLGDIILGDWSQYLEGTYQPLQTAESIHVRFVNHERAFKFWLRNAGMPWWDAALTPKNGSPTLSPFVTLEAR